MKLGSFMLFFSLLLSVSGCGSQASPPSSQPVGADVVQKYAFVTKGQAITISTALPQGLIGEDWSLKANLCQQAGYDLGPYAGQDVSLTRYNLDERYRCRLIIQSTDLNGGSQTVDVDVDLPLYLWIISRDGVTLGAYLSVAEFTTAYLQLRHIGFFMSDLLAVDDVHIK